MFEDRHHARSRSRDRRVDALGRQQNDPANLVRFAACFEGRLQRGVILESGESIEAGDEQFGHADVLGMRSVDGSGEADSAKQVRAWSVIGAKKETVPGVREGR